MIEPKHCQKISVQRTKTQLKNFGKAKNNEFSNDIKEEKTQDIKIIPLIQLRRTSQNSNNYPNNYVKEINRNFYFEDNSKKKLMNSYKTKKISIDYSKSLKDSELLYTKLEDRYKGFYELNDTMISDFFVEPKLP